MNATTTKIGYNMFVVVNDENDKSVFEGIPPSVKKYVYGRSVMKRISCVAKLKS